MASVFFEPASGFEKQGEMAKRTRITIQTDSLLILYGKGTRRAWCPSCAAEGEMLALGEVGVVSNLARREVDEWLGSKALHRCEGADGSWLICLKSLLDRLANPDTPN